MKTKQLYSHLINLLISKFDLFSNGLSERTYTPFLLDWHFILVKTDNTNLSEHYINGIVF